MELCQGRNLFQYVKKKKPVAYLSEKEAFLIFKQILSAIAYMHNLGLIHRDLKLENILINDVGGMNLIKIIDFGFATACQADTRLSLYCGTLWYMDPDLAKERKYSGQAGDVWALGVILFLLITGDAPF